MERRRINILDLVNTSDPTDDLADIDHFAEMWLYEMKGLDLKSPLDAKARDAAIAYFDGRPRSVSGCAERLGVERKTAARRLQRASDKGWLTLYAEPFKAGEATLSRVVGRKAFWPGGLPEWDGDTSNPVF